MQSFIENTQLEKEKKWLTDNQIDLIISDVASMPLKAGSHLKIPTILIGNFTWHDIYSHLPRSNNNSELITIDLEIVSFTYSASIIFAVILFAGWLFGILCCSFYILKLLNERRLLRSTIKSKEKTISDSKHKTIKDAN